MGQDLNECLTTVEVFVTGVGESGVAMTSALMADVYWPRTATHELRGA